MTDSQSILDYTQSLGLASRGDGSGCLVYHPDSTDEIECSPLVVVFEGNQCRVTVAHFSKGDLVPGLSVTVDSFGAATDAEAAAREIARVIRETYARSTSTETL